MGGIYTLLTGDIAFTGQTEDAGALGRGLGALDAALVVTPWVRPVGRALGALARSNPGRLSLIGAAGLGAAAYGTDAEAGVLRAAAKLAINLNRPAARGVSSAQRSVLAAELRSARAAGASLNELQGIRHGTYRMWQRGYDLRGSLHYAGNQGLDLGFTKTVGGRTRYAVLEAKAGHGGGRERYTHPGA